MLIRDWMTRKPVTATPETSMMRASKLLKEGGFRRLPVVDKDGKLVGIVTDRDIKEASPSKATTLDMHELYYLLSELELKDIMVHDPIRISAADTVETAALIMVEKNVGGLPVVDEHDKVVGIITESDVFKLLIEITGAKHGGVQMAFELPASEGALKAVLDDLKAHDARIMSIMTMFKTAESETREVYIRILPMERFKENQIVEAFAKKYRLRYWARDNVHPLA